MSRMTYFEYLATLIFNTDILKYVCTTKFCISKCKLGGKGCI